jgi:hypothetical protein
MRKRKTSVLAGVSGTQRFAGDLTERKGTLPFHDGCWYVSTVPQVSGIFRARDGPESAP